MSRFNMFLEIMGEGKRKIEKIAGREIGLHEDMDEVLEEVVKG